MYQAEKTVTKASYDPQDYGDVDKINNIYSFSAIEKQFPNVDLRVVFAATGLAATDRVLVLDPGAMQAAAGFFTDGNLATLKALSRTGLIMAVGGCLDPEFTDASFDFNEQYLGIAMRQSTGQLAAQQVQALLASEEPM